MERGGVEGEGEELVPRDIFVAREVILGESLPGSFEQKELSPMGQGERERDSLPLFDEQIPRARPRNFKVWGEGEDCTISFQHLHLKQIHGKKNGWSVSVEKFFLDRKFIRPAGFTIVAKVWGGEERGVYELVGRYL